MLTLDSKCVFAGGSVATPTGFAPGLGIIQPQRAAIGNVYMC